MNLPPFLLQALTLAATVKYPLLFLGAIIEGPVLFVASGFFLHLGLVSLLPLFLALLAGDLVGDAAWYYIGYFFAEPMMRKHGKFFSLTPVAVEKAKALFSRHRGKILFISKATLGFGTSVGTLVVLMTAGVTRVPLAKYLLLNALGEIVLLTLLISAGYLFGSLYGSIADSFKIVSLMGSGAVVLLLVFGFGRFVKGRVLL